MKIKPILLLCVLLGGAVAHAGALLKPTSGVTQALRAKSLDVQSDINGAFAQTTVTTIYDNPNDTRIEADFIYSAPAGAVVTGFAYWYGSEKVVARVVEKERAAQIYQYITSRMRDPALVEMIGKNTFRARIFPVEPRTDLKIEVQFAQMLDATPKGWKWNFPLREETGAAPLDSMTMKIHVAGDRAATSNAGELDARDNLNIKRTGFTGTDDVRVEIAGKTPEFYAARDGGSDGFFALALKGKGADIPKISGVKIYDLASAKSASGARFLFGRYRGAGAATAGAAKLQFSNRVAKGNVASQLWAASFIEDLSKRDANRERVVALSKRFGMPSKWTSWLAIPTAERANFKKQILASDRESAARAYASAVARGDSAAAAREKIRVAQVTKELVAVGEDYSSNEERQSLASYLNQELKNVRRAQTQAKYEKISRAKLASLKQFERNLRRAGAKDDADGVEMPVYLLEDELRIGARLLAGEVANGRGNGARAKGLQARLDELANTKVAHNYGWGANEFMDEQVRARTQDLALEIAANRLSDKPSASFQAQKTLQMQRLTKRFGGDAKEQIQYATQAAAQPRAQKLAQEIAANRLAAKPSATLQAQKTAQLQRLAKMYGGDAKGEIDGATSAVAAPLAQGLATQIVAQEASGKSIVGRPRLTELAKLAGQNPDDLLKTARTENVRQNYNATTDDLVSEVLAGRENSEKARKLQTQVEDYARNSNDEWQKDAVQRAYNGRSHELAYSIEAERAKSAPDANRINSLEAQLSETAAKTNSNPGGYLDWEKRRVAEKQGPVKVEDYRYRVAGLNPSDFPRGYGAGDPLLQISAPADAKSVIAIMPNGEIKPLEWRAATKRWEANFDIPMGTRADSYLVTIVIVSKDGVRHVLKMRYRVDDQAPKGDAKIQLNAGAPTDAPADAQSSDLNLEVSASDDVSRVVALLPWGERLVLRRGKDGAFATKVTVPATWDKPSVPVRFILIDTAHNRTELNVNWNK